MQFQDFKYIRPDVDKIKAEFSTLLNQFNNANNVSIQYDIIDKINEITNTIQTMCTLVSIRHSINTADEFYDKENEYIDSALPIFQGLTVDYYKALLDSNFKAELEKKYGKHLFDLAEMNIKTFSDDVLTDMQEENRLSSSYSKLTASAKIEFNGEIKNLSQMIPYMQSTDRKIRKEAYEKWTSFFIEHEHEFDDIYDKLVKVRTKIAQKLGYDNYVELGYLRMNRSDYNKNDVQNYREQVYKYIVPLATELRNRQASRLGVDKLMYYDIPLSYTNGNAKPKGDRDWMIDKAQIMYSELSSETKLFFDFMVKGNLLDLDSKQNKQAGGYCTYLPDYKSPFIFANFNGTSGDVDVLTHEAGHAFQVFESRSFDVPEYMWPTYEACEIHSMSMEFITWPWMKLFFEELETKYKFAHLSEGILFIPYGVTVDEFQHYVYENPNATPEQRKTKWREIERKYLPSLDYGDNEFLDKGCYWFKQGHIFNNPFYYIDYTLAQVCAYQYWIKFNENRPSAWNDYLRLCRAGGSKSFLELLKIGNLKSPFDNNTVKEIIPEIRKYLNSIDDNNL